MLVTATIRVSVSTSWGFPYREDSASVMLGSLETTAIKV